MAVVKLYDFKKNTRDGRSSARRREKGHAGKRREARRKWRIHKFRMLE